MESEEVDWLRRSARSAGIAVSKVVIPTSRHLVVRGVRLHFLDWGGDFRTTIVFLHGGGLNAHTFDLVCLALCSKYRCISVDLRGHGDSEWPPLGEYSVSAHAGDVAAFVDELDLSDFVLVGMSLGGMAAMTYAGSHSDRLLGLVIIDIGPDMQRENAVRVRQFMNGTSGEIESLDAYIGAAVQFNPRRDPDRLRRSLHYNLRRTPRGSWVWKWDPRVNARSVDDDAFEKRREGLWASVSGIRCPTVVVHGIESDVFTRDNARALVDRLSDGRYAPVASAGHTVQGDNPAGLVSVFEPFLQEVVASGGS